jgi:predicted metalloprotease with PDZ domain
VPYDWRGLLTDRVLKVAEHAPLDGLENSGWKLVYTDKPNQIAKLGEHHGVDAIASLGLALSSQGNVQDAIEGGVASRQGIGPGMKIIAVNGRRYSSDLLINALRDAQRSHTPIQLIVENTEYYRTVSLAYYDGLRYPHLVRIEGQPDLLGDILKPRVTTLPEPFKGQD